MFIFQAHMKVALTVVVVVAVMLVCVASGSVVAERKRTRAVSPVFLRRWKSLALQKEPPATQAT